MKQPDGWGMVWDGNVHHLISSTKTPRVSPPLAVFWLKSWGLCQSNWKSLKFRKSHILFELCLWEKLLFTLEFPLNNSSSLALWFFEQCLFFLCLGSTWYGDWFVSLTEEKKLGAGFHLLSLHSFQVFDVITSSGAVLEIQRVLFVSFDCDADCRSKSLHTS